MRIRVSYRDPIQPGVDGKWGLGLRGLEFRVFEFRVLGSED